MERNSGHFPSFDVVSDNAFSCGAHAKAQTHVLRRRCFFTSHSTILPPIRRAITEMSDVTKSEKLEPRIDAVETVEALRLGYQINGIVPFRLYVRVLVGRGCAPSSLT